MNEKAKDFIAKVMADPELKAKLDSFGTPKTQKERKQITEQKVIPWAKELGYNLTLEDFIGVNKKEMDDTELEAVAGGQLGCVCAVAGGGGGKNADGSTYGCACAMYGQGGNAKDKHDNCYCFMAGDGTDTGSHLGS